MFRQKFSQFFSKTSFYNHNKFKISTKEHKNNFDVMLKKWLHAIVPGRSLAYSLAGINIALFLWCNFTTKNNKRWNAFEHFSYSLESFKNRDYINLLISPLVSRRIDDLIFDTGILLTLGNYNHNTNIIYN